MEADGTEPASALAATVLPRSAAVPVAFINDGVTPVPYGVAMFAATDPRQSTVAWPEGVRVTPLVAAALVYGPR